MAVKRIKKKHCGFIGKLIKFRPNHVSILSIFNCEISCIKNNFYKKKEVSL